MFLNQHRHFAFVPFSANRGMLHVLEPASGYCNGSFVVVPYVNPAKKSVHPEFYKVVESNEIEFVLPDTPETKVSIAADTDFEMYRSSFEKLQAHIRRGDIYEINYCCQFSGQAENLDPLRLCMKLFEVSAAPYCYLVRLGDDFIISASPELFLKKEGMQLITKPIKGTSKRGATPSEDDELKENLFHSIKERTENVMAVDVARNDLSILAARGTVTVNKLYNIETFMTVHQMVSTVKCTMNENFSFQKVMEATFPMASMTGAPKKSAMRIIDEVETFERKYYSGAMGFIDAVGNFELAVVIRSIFYDAQSKKISLAVGGAITHLCNAQDEYNECLLKAQGMFRALGVKI